jgi:hypothetical protein
MGSESGSEKNSFGSTTLFTTVMIIDKLLNQMLERLSRTGLLPRFTASESLAYHTEAPLDPGVVGTLLAGTCS